MKPLQLEWCRWGMPVPFEVSRISTICWQADPSVLQATKGELVSQIRSEGSVGYVYIYEMTECHVNV